MSAPGCIFALGVILTTAGAVAEASAISLEAGVSAFETVDGGCARSLTPGAVGTEAPGTATTATTTAEGAAAGLGPDPLAEIGNCFQGENLVDDLVITGTTQVVSTQLPAFPGGEVHDGGQGVGSVSVSVPYESDFFTPLFSAPGRKTFGIDSAFSESDGATALSTAGSAINGGSGGFDGFRQPVEYAELGPATALPGAYNFQTTGGGNKAKNRSAPQPPAEGLPAFWVLILGVLGFVGVFFAIFSLVSIIVGLARRRAA